MTRLLDNNWVIVLLTVLLLLCIIVSAIYMLRPTMDRVDWERATYTVRTGDSLWSISGRYCPDNVDRREWIAKVQKMNHLDGSIIHVGEKLTILRPAED